MSVNPKGIIKLKDIFFHEKPEETIRKKLYSKIIQARNMPYTEIQN